MQISTQRITPCLGFDHQAEEAVRFYVATFKDARIRHVTRCGDNEPGGPGGSVRTIAFQLFGQDFLAVNGGPHFRFNDGVSLVVNCHTQAEIDELWAKLTDGGEPIQCGWLKDRFGLSWQIVPAELNAMMSDPDPAKSERVMQAVLGMVKPDIAALRRAYHGSS